MHTLTNTPRHVIITGGSSGIGLALAALYGQQGARITLIARSPERLAQAAERLVALGVVNTAIEAADVTDEAALATAITGAQVRFGPCDLLITSAGLVEPAAFETQSSADFDSQMRTNFSGTVYAVRAVYPAMKARRAGHILMISSGAALIGIHSYSAYCASKAALHGFAEALATEARPAGVGISICFPPDTDTPQLTAERLKRPVEADMLMGAVRVWTADAVARRAARGLERGEFAVFCGVSLTALGVFGSLVKPVLYWLYNRRLLARRPV